MASYVVHKDKLKGEYLKLFEQAEFYGISNYISDMEMEEGMSSLLDVLCEAQSEGRALSDIVGEDAEEFCKAFFENPSPITNMLRATPRFIFRISVLALIFTICDIVNEVTDGKELLAVTSDIAPYIISVLLGNIVGIIVLSLFRKVMFRYKKLSFNIVSLLVLIFSVSISLVCYYQLNEYYSKYVTAIWVAVICALYIIGYQAYIWRRRYKIYGSISKSKEEKERTFAGIVKDIIDDSDMAKDELLNVIEKKYNRMNRRRMKKGQPEVTYAEFQEKFLKENNLLKNERKYMAVFYAVIVITSTLGVLQESEPADALIFGAILTILETLIWRGIYGVQRKTVAKRFALAQECERRNITIMDIINEYKDKNPTNIQSPLQ